VNLLCKICGKKRARRHCPGVSGEICPTCCGTEREVTVDCPIDCEYLRIARQHEQPAELIDIPNKDVRISENFIREHEQLITWLTMALAEVMQRERAVDSDAGEALEALVRTYRTRESGLIYETRPQNPYAAAIQTALVESIAELHKTMTKETGMHTLRDAEVLGALIFLQRMALQHANGRRRGRAFFDFLRSYFPEQAAPSASLEI
jgi:hypothetical protein